MAVNPLYAAWIQKFHSVNNVDGGRAVHAVLLAYGLSVSGDMSTVLHALINVGRMDKTNQLEKTFEAFCQSGSDALKAGYPAGNELLQIVIRSGVGYKSALQMVSDFCRTTRLMMPSGTLASAAPAQPRSYPAPSSVPVQPTRRVAFVCADADQLETVTTVLKAHVGQFTSTSIGAPSMARTGIMQTKSGSTFELMLVSGNVVSTLQTAWVPHLVCIVGTISGVRGKCNLGDVLVAEALEGVSGSLISDEVKAAVVKIAFTQGKNKAVDSSWAASVVDKRPKYSKRFVKEALLKVLYDFELGGATTGMTPLAAMNALVEKYPGIPFKTEWPVIKAELVAKKLIPAQGALQLTDIARAEIVAVEGCGLERCILWCGYGDCVPECKTRAKNRLWVGRCWRRDDVCVVLYGLSGEDCYINKFLIKQSKITTSVLPSLSLCDRNRWGKRSRKIPCCLLGGGLVRIVDQW